MDKSILTKEESELYIKIVKNGNYDDMFDFGYAIGIKKLAEENIELLTK